MYGDAGHSAFMYITAGEHCDERHVSVFAVYDFAGHFETLHFRVNRYFNAITSN